MWVFVFAFSNGTRPQPRRPGAEEVEFRNLSPRVFPRVGRRTNKPSSGNREDRLFAEALEVNAGPQRNAFSIRFAGEAELRQRLENLSAAHEATSSALESLWE
jgi:hypothetical protein